MPKAEGRKGAKGPALGKVKAAKAGAGVSYDCTYAGKKYSNGTYLCQEGELFQCTCGVWVDQQKKCPCP